MTAGYHLFKTYKSTVHRYLIQLFSDHGRVNMYLYVSDKDSQATFVNTPQDFLVKLPGGLNLSGEIGLCEIHIEFVNEAKCIDLCCDLCDTSIVGETANPLLRRIHLQGSRLEQSIVFDPVYYIPVIKPQSDTLRLYIKTPSSESSSVAIKTVSCTLHIKP